ncbi:MAG: 50S ribosomal protein L18 [Candidatus Omnitrophica bacterium]|nr:50S ribosomal protein L18 [Candidatus Omnitrophota bacterium]
MDRQKLKQLKREKIHKRIRKKIFGTLERPRMYVHKTHKHMYVQFIDDTKGKTLMSISTLSKELKPKINFGGNIKAASLLGEFAAQKALLNSIKKVVLDRGPYPYHGRIKAFAEAARKGGLDF